MSSAPSPLTGDGSDSCSYFLGSERPEDYIIDLDLAPEAQPLDVQAYLQCVATVSDFDEYERLPSAPYEPRLDKIAEGAQMLRDEYRANGPGIWLTASDIKPEDMEACPRNPWLSVLLRTNRLSSMPSVWEHFEDEGGEEAVIHGNVRIAMPPGFVGPAKSNNWLVGTFTLYGESHPALKAAKTSKALTDVQLYEIGHRAGNYYDSRPVLPLTPQLQEWFDKDPKAYTQWVRGRIVHNELMYFPPVGAPPDW